ncbi:MAG: hypothetical protein NUV97_03010 [archaeon]|nr:hypothetical protein [archaeon]MCR4324041.1 hypothetical protein [Nanoarchaeota archaeon]
MKRLKLKTSARDKRRYFLTRSSNESIEKAILEYLGVLGFAKATYKKIVDKELPQDKTIGSCLTKSLNDVRTALSMAGINIERVSGTIKGLMR